MSWSHWIECKIDRTGEIDTTTLRAIENGPGVFAIATRADVSSYHPHYLGRADCLRDRIKSFMRSYQNFSQQLGLMMDRKETTDGKHPQPVYIAIFPTESHEESETYCNLLASVTKLPALT